MMVLRVPLELKRQLLRSCVALKKALLQSPRERSRWQGPGRGVLQRSPAQSLAAERSSRRSSSSGRTLTRRAEPLYGTLPPADVSLNVRYAGK